MWLFLFTGEYFWLITIASASLAGTFPVLRGSFTPFQILMGLGVAKFLADDMVMRRTRLSVGPAFDRIMICGFMAIITLHALMIGSECAFLDQRPGAAETMSICTWPRPHIL